MTPTITLLIIIIGIIGWALYAHSLYRIALLGDEIVELLEWKETYLHQKKLDQKAIEELERKLKSLSQANQRFNERMTKIDKIFDSAALRDFIKKNEND